MLNSFKEFLYSFISTVLASFDIMLDDATNVLVTGGGIDIWDDVVAFSTSLRPFCYTVIAICLLIELLQTAMKVDVLKWEQGIKVGIKIVLSKVCIDVAPTALRAIYQQAADWCSVASTASFGNGITDMGDLVSTDMENMINSLSGWGPVLGLFMSLLIVVIAIKICGLLIQVIAYGRIFEIYVYLAVSPLPCSFLPLGGGSGSNFSRLTARFFKSFAAICLQSVIMIVSIRVFGKIMETAITNQIAASVTVGGSQGVSDLCYTMLLGCVVLVMSVVKSGSWAKGILDAM